jgi:hypothetical protein
MEGVFATSFFKPVRITASRSADAERRALNLVRSEWVSGPYAAMSQSGPPRLSIDSVTSLPWWHRFSLRRHGYVFAPDDAPNGSNMRWSGP